MNRQGPRKSAAGAASLEPLLTDPAAVAAHPAVATGDVLDARPAAAFRAGHVAGAFSWPLPDAGTGPPDADVLAVWLPGHRLPPRHAPLLVVEDDPAALAAVVRFLRRGGRRADGAPWPLVRDAAARHGAPVLADGPGRPSLCRPDPWLVARRHLLPPPAAGPVLDCGCGSGRNAVWLAQRGYRVTAVDRDPGALARLRDLAAAHGVAVATATADLADPAAVPPGPWGVLLAVRCLERSLLRRAPSLLRPGGVVALRTFRWDATAADVLPRRRFCLEGGEPASLLPAPPFTILDLVADTDPDGRPAAGIVARYDPSPAPRGHSST